ncbi:MAG: FliM/FliN family flagellar motor switch protein [Rhizobiaceae bacterium]|nr:FliM/FliN family flagellar motor switch protein [Rhizobiaceae bacterium]
MNAPWTPPLFGEGLDRGALWNAFLALAGRGLAIDDQRSMGFQLAEPPAPDAHCLRLQLAGDSRSIVCEVRDFPFRDLFQVELSVADLAMLPDGVREAVTEGMIASLRSLLPPDFAADLTIAEEGPAARFLPALGPEASWFSVRLQRIDGLFADLRVGAPPSLIVGRLSRDLLFGIGQPGPLAETLMITADVTLGAITLAAGELAALEQGAVVVMAETHAETLKVRVGEIVYAFTQTGEGWRCSGPQSLDRHRPRAALHRQESRLSEDMAPATGDAADHPGTDVAAPADAAEPSAISLSDLRIAIDFDLGRSMVPLGTIAAWQQGMVIDLALPTLTDGVEVTIRANGDVVGHGDLVRIDDRIGVRITRFALRS